MMLSLPPHFFVAEWMPLMNPTGVDSGAMFWMPSWHQVQMESDSHLYFTLHVNIHTEVEPAATTSCELG